jgi:hypothetical protein
MFARQAALSVSEKATSETVWKTETGPILKSREDIGISKVYLAVLYCQKPRSTNSPAIYQTVSLGRSANSGQGQAAFGSRV